jgi:hypothetical protein
VVNEADTLPETLETLNDYRSVSGKEGDKELMDRVNYLPSTVSVSRVLCREVY